MELILQIQLIAVLGVFAFKLLLEYIKQVRIILFSTVLLCLLVGSLITTLLSAPKPALNLPLTTTTITTGTNHQFTLQEYNQSLTQLISLANLQPTHRDILINLSLLLKAQHQDDKAREYWLAARRLDPNNSFFSQEDFSTL